MRIASVKRNGDQRRGRCHRAVGRRHGLRSRAGGRRGPVAVAARAVAGIPTPGGARLEGLRMVSMGMGPVGRTSC
jgi:hypothetical protein